MVLDRLMRTNETPPEVLKILTLSRTYAATVGEIIIKSYGGRQPDTKQLAIETAIFMEPLYGKIPEHRLNECYVEAVRTRKSTFPLKPEEMCAAWETIRQRDFYKRAPESRQLTHGFCEKCNNCGNEVIYNDKGHAIGSRPCHH